MERKIVTGIMLTLLLVSMLTLAFNIRRAKSSEPPPTEWTRTYGGTGNDYAYSVVQTSDGGYAVAGRGFADLVKTDANGNQQWNKTYGGRAYSLVNTVDDGYALIGTKGDDFWLVKTDSAGNEQWNQTYKGTGGSYGHSVVQTSDGGYAIAGETEWGGDVWLVKTDSAGNEQWNQTYGREYEDRAWSMTQTSDGGYAIAGNTFSYGVSDYDFLLVKTDSAGNEQWNQIYGGTSADHGWCVVQTSDGGYAIAGNTFSYSVNQYPDVWLVKTDSAGNEQWNQTYGGTSSDYARSVVQTSDGGYAIAGYTDSFGAGYMDFLLVKTDSAGNEQWNQTYGGTSSDHGHSVVQTVDGGYAIVGQTYSFGAGYWDFWLVKVGPELPYDVTIDAYCYTEDAYVSVSITMDGTPTGYNTPHTFTGLTNTHTFTVPNADANGHQFRHWSTGSTSATITVNSGGPYTAYYGAYDLTITTTTGGTTDPTPGTYEYAPGAVAVVLAIPDTGSGYIFDHWELNGGNVGSTNPINVIMTSDLTLHAVFSWVGTYDLTITTTTGGTTDPTPGTYEYAPGAVAVVSAIPDTNYWFDHWELDGNYFGSTNPISVTMNTHHTLHAVSVDTPPTPVPEYPGADISIVAATFGFLAALYFALKRKKQAHPTTSVTRPSKALTQNLMCNEQLLGKR